MDDVMTPDEFFERMEEFYGDGHFVYDDSRQPSYDPELAHHLADKLIIELLKDLGYSKGAELFETAERWYG